MQNNKHAIRIWIYTFVVPCLYLLSRLYKGKEPITSIYSVPEFNKVKKKITYNKCEHYDDGEGDGG